MNAYNNVSGHSFVTGIILLIIYYTKQTLLTIYIFRGFFMLG